MLCMSERKEVHFFDNDDYFIENNPNYSIYHSSFPSKSSHRLLGEVTPIYMYWKYAPERIFKYNPEVKLIIVLRNPVDRAYSHWNMERSRYNESMSFWDAIQSEGNRSKLVFPDQHRIYSYVDRGFYYKQLKRLWHYFSKDNMLILNYDFFKSNPIDTLNIICDYLGIERFLNIEPITVHALPYESLIGEKEKQYLIDVYRQDIHKIEESLGWNCSNWLS